MLPSSGPVLLIEDHAGTRHMVQEYLTFSGIEVVAAADGREGLAQLQDQKPCLILLDLMMPVMDGWQFRAAQRRLPDRALSEVPVIVLSAVHDVKNEADRLGAIDVIPKPIDLDQMLSVVRQHCGEA